MHKVLVLGVLVAVFVLAHMPVAAQQQETVEIELRHAAQQFTTNGCLSSSGTATFTISPPVQTALLPTEVVATTESGTELRARIFWKLDAGGDSQVWEQYLPASVETVKFVGGAAAVQARTNTPMWRGAVDVFQRTAAVHCFNFIPLLLTR